MKAGWLLPFIIIVGALQSCGAAMNCQLCKSLLNPWLASALSFALITFFFVGLSSSCRTLCRPPAILRRCLSGHRLVV